MSGRRLGAAVVGRAKKRRRTQDDPAARSAVGRPRVARRAGATVSNPEERASFAYGPAVLMAADWSAFGPVKIRIGAMAYDAVSRSLYGCIDPGSGGFPGIVRFDAEMRVSSFNEVVDPWRLAMVPEACRTPTTHLVVCTHGGEIWVLGRDGQDRRVRMIPALPPAPRIYGFGLDSRGRFVVSDSGGRRLIRCTLRPETRGAAGDEAPVVANKLGDSGGGSTRELGVAPRKSTEEAEGAAGLVADCEDLPLPLGGDGSSAREIAIDSMDGFAFEKGGQSAVLRMDAHRGNLRALLPPGRELPAVASLAIDLRTDCVFVAGYYGVCAVDAARLCKIAGHPGNVAPALTTARGTKFRGIRGIALETPEGRDAALLASLRAAPPADVWPPGLPETVEAYARSPARSTALWINDGGDLYRVALSRPQPVVQAPR
jgi:hypothetical protein